MSAPRIGQLSKRTKGIILLGGNSHPLEKLILEQYIYLASEDGVTEPAEIELIEDYQAQLLALYSITDSTKSTGNLPLGLPLTYWKYLLNYNQVKTAQELEKPIFIIQGKRDYQVPIAEYTYWQKALQNKSNVSFKAYEKLNHIMREGEGPSYPVEYDIKSPLSNYLVEDIANWVLKNN